MRAKSSTCNSISSNPGYFRGGNVRESLNHLRRSINRSLILPCIENDSEENLCISEEDVKELRLHIEDNMKDDSENGESALLFSAEGCETEFTCEHYLSCSDESETEEINSTENQTEMPCPNSSELVEEPDNISKIPIALDLPLRKSLSISDSHQSSVLEDPVLSESPKIKNSQRKSLIFTSNHLPVQDDVEHTCTNLDVIRQSLQADSIRSSLRSSRIFAGPTESLAASLHRGLQIIDHHQRNSDPARSSVSFSFEHLALKPCLTADKANVSVQNSPEENPSDQPSATFVCIKCQGRRDSNETGDSMKSLVTVDESASSNGLAVYVTKVCLK